MDVEEITTRLTSRFGDGVTDWCAAVPELADRLAARWDLTFGGPSAQGASSVVLRCARPDGTPAILKLTPDRAFLVEQTAMLRAFAPSGRVPAVLAVDVDAGAILLEAIEPGTMVDELADRPSPRQWAELLNALHSVDPALDPPRHLRGRCEEFFDRIGRRLADPAIGAHLDEATWQRAIRRVDALLASASTEVLLHGDLHLGNVLDGGRSRGLVAVDPKACVGDPCFDAVDYVLDAAGRDGVDVRCQRLADATGLDADRLHAWSRAVATVVAVSYVANRGVDDAGTAELLTLAR